MTNSKNTKRAFLASALSVVLCTAMFVGSTFAWFTDSAATGVNKIQAGNLKIALETSTDGETWVDVGEDPLAFVQVDEDAGKDILWEPGCTYKLPELRIANKGNLALKFKLLVNGLSGTADEEAVVADLAEVIDVYTGTTKDDVADANKIGTLRELMEDADGAAYGVILPKGETDPDGEGGVSVEATDGYTLLFHMQEAAGNKYQDMNLDGISFTVVATQYTYENDSFDNEYDEAAEYPVQDVDDLKSAIKAAKPGDTIAMTADIVSDENLSIPEGVVLDGLGNTLITEAKLYADKGATLRNINFEKPVNAKNNASFVYASNLANELIIENCTFVDTQWDAIQVTPTAGANVVIRNNVFKTTENVVSVNNGKCERYIHVQATGANVGSKFTVTITGNKFENIDKCRNSVIDVDNLESKTDITVGQNTFSGFDVTEDNLGSVIWIVTGSNVSTNEASMDDYQAFIGDDIVALK